SVLLIPQHVCRAVFKRLASKPGPFESLERLDPNVIGDRECMLGGGLVGGKALRESNPLKANRHLTNAWYNGTTGLPVFDDLVKKLLARGYAHHSERLLIAGSLMTICEISPADIKQWFNELFVDTHDWALVPHVYA